jgi:hypothetical protein
MPSIYLKLRENGYSEYEWRIEVLMNTAAVWKESVLASGSFLPASEYNLADYYLLVELSGPHEKKSAKALAVLSGVTLTVIPFKQQTITDFRAVLFDKDFNALGETQMSGAVHILGWLPLLPLSFTPLGYVPRSTKQMRSNAFDDLLDWANDVICKL